MKLFKVLVFVILLSSPAYARMVIGGTTSVMVGVSDGGGGGGLLLGYVNEDTGFEVINYLEVVGSDSVNLGNHISVDPISQFVGLQDKITIGKRFNVTESFAVSGYAYVSLAGLYGGEGQFPALGSKGTLVNVEFGSGGGVAFIFSKVFGFYAEVGGVSSNYMYGGSSLDEGNYGGARISMGFRAGNI